MVLVYYQESSSPYPLIRYCSAVSDVVSAVVVAAVALVGVVADVVSAVILFVDSVGP